MARIKDIANIDKDYIKSGRWKCPDSPTGAHHSEEVSSKGRYTLFRCRYCPLVQRLPTGYDMAAKGTTKDLMDPILNPKLL